MDRSLRLQQEQLTLQLRKHEERLARRERRLQEQRQQELEQQELENREQEELRKAREQQEEEQRNNDRPQLLARVTLPQEQR